MLALPVLAVGVSQHPIASRLAPTAKPHRLGGSRSSGEVWWEPACWRWGYRQRNNRLEPPRRRKPTKRC